MEYNKSSPKNVSKTVKTSENKEFSLKINNFNPMKGSPNLFLTKLEFRLRNYHVEKALSNDPLQL